MPRHQSVSGGVVILGRRPPAQGIGVSAFVHQNGVHTTALSQSSFVEEDILSARPSSNIFSGGRRCLLRFMSKHH